MGCLRDSGEFKSHGPCDLEKWMRHKRPGNLYFFPNVLLFVRILLATPFAAQVNPVQRGYLVGAIRSSRKWARRVCFGLPSVTRHFHSLAGDSG
jgi:hypothetical protein